MRWRLTVFGVCTAAALVGSCLWVPTREFSGTLLWAKEMARGDWYTAKLREFERSAPEPAFQLLPGPDAFPGMTFREHWRSLRWMWVWNRRTGLRNARFDKRAPNRDEICVPVLLAEQALIVLLAAGFAIWGRHRERRRLVASLFPASG